MKDIFTGIIKIFLFYSLLNIMITIDSIESHEILFSIFLNKINKLTNLVLFSDHQK
jgi:succinate dehydrogenase hydrophobic anchor subunit